MTKRVILVNGPSRVGKNTASTMLRDILGGADIIGFSHHLKRMVHGVYLGRKGWDMDPDAFDGIKSEPQALLSGMSWRQAYIYYSESVIKPLHGKEWFGEQFVHAMDESREEFTIVPDSGFREEAERTVRHVGRENVLLVRMHKAGVTFEGDSRSYISLSDLGVERVDVVNTHGDFGSLRSELAEAVEAWLETV